MSAGGFKAVFCYVQPLEAYALRRGLQEHREAVVALSDWQAVYDDDSLFEQVGDLLRPYPSVVLLLPPPDVDKSLRILDERQQVVVDGMEIDEHFVKHHSNHDLAKLTAYTEGKTAEDTRYEILSRVDGPFVMLVREGDMLFLHASSLPEAAENTIRLI